THNALIIALPSVSRLDSRYAALAVANALFARRLRTQLQFRDPQVLYARSLLDKTFVPGLWYVYATTVSAKLQNLIDRILELAESVIKDGPVEEEVDEARRYLWEDRCRTQGP